MHAAGKLATITPNRNSDLESSRLSADGYARLSQFSAAHARMSPPHLQDTYIRPTNRLVSFQALVRAQTLPLGLQYEWTHSVFVKMTLCCLPQSLEAVSNRHQH